MAKVKYRYNGRWVTKEELESLLPPKPDWLDSRSPFAPSTYSEHDPLISEGCGVMKAQVKETRESIKKHGIQGAAVLPSGQVRFTSRKARKEFLKMRGFVDKDGGYSD